MTRAGVGTQVRETAARLQHPVVAVGLGMVLVQVLFRAWMLKDGWFFTDDYLLLSEALTNDLDLAYLLRPENGHLMPATRFVYYLVAHFGWLNWPLAVAIAVLLQLIASLSALWMLVTLFGRRWATLPPLAIYCTTAITAQASLWWVSIVNQTPMQIAMFLAVGCWVQYLRSRSTAWLTGTVLAVLFSLLFFQKGLLILVVLIYLMLAFFTTGGLVARISQSVRQHWQAALAVGTVSLIYLAYYLSVTDGTGQPQSGGWFETFSAMFLRAFSTGIIGGPNGWSPRPGGAWADPTALQLFVAWSVILTVVATSIVLRRRAGRAWILLAIYYAALATTITATRSGYFGSDIALAYRLQTDGVAVAILALSLAFMPILGSKEPNEARCQLPVAWTQRVHLMAAAALVVVCVNGLGNWLWFAKNWNASNGSRSYVTQLREDMVRIGQADLTDQVVPRAVLSQLAAPYNTLSTVAPAILGPGASFPRSTGRLVRVSPGGQMHQAVLAAATKEIGRPQGVCGWRLSPGEGRRISMRTPTDPATWWVRIGYLAAGSGEARVRVGSDVFTVQLRDGLHSAFIQTEQPVSDIHIGGLTSDVEICLDTVEVGTAQLGARL